MTRLLKIRCKLACWLCPELVRDCQTLGEMLRVSQANVLQLIDKLTNLQLEKLPKHKRRAVHLELVQ